MPRWPRAASSFQKSLSAFCLNARGPFNTPSATTSRPFCFKQGHRLFHATLSSLSQTTSAPFSKGATLRGHSGRTYSIQEILANRRDPLLCEFEYQQDLQQPVAACPNLRTVIDTIPDFELFVFPFCAGNLLQFSQKPLSQETRRRILRSVLTGLAELHDRGIFHSDIKPDNILLDHSPTAGDDPAIRTIQIADLEDATLLRPGRNLRGCVCGSQLWRSPESWARARQNTPSDMFSFGVVAIYVTLKHMIFRVSDEQLDGEDAWWHMLRTHVSYFADEEGIKGLLRHIGEEDPFFDRLLAPADDFGAERPRKPFALWHYVDVEFRDLIQKTNSLDPAKRITAREALAHPWFQRVEMRLKVSQVVVD